MAQIDTTAVINAIRLAQQGSNPASPAATYWVLFIKSDGLYIKDSAGNVMGPIRGMANSTLWDAAGDLAYATAADTGTRLGIGTANQVLRVNSGATAPEWVSAGRVLITESTPTGTGTVSWTSIPATYKSLEIEVIARSTQAATNVALYIQFNGDNTAANYRFSLSGGYGTGSFAGDGGDNYSLGSIIPGASSDAGAAGQVNIKINDYSNTTFQKYALATFANRRDSGSIFLLSGVSGCGWETYNAAINRVDMILSAGNYDTGSKLRLYGVY